MFFVSKSNPFFFFFFFFFFLCLGDTSEKSFSFFFFCDLCTVFLVCLRFFLVSLVGYIKLLCFFLDIVYTTMYTCNTIRHKINLRHNTDANLYFSIKASLGLDFFLVQAKLLLTYNLKCVSIFFMNKRREVRIYTAKKHFICMY